VDGSKSYFDTNTGDHHHFYLEDEGRLEDIPGPALSVGALPEPPPGMVIDRIDVIVRVKRRTDGA
jgi:Fur family iron response transcriptional regulator